MRLDVVYNDLRQLSGFGGRRSAGLPFRKRKLLANGGKPDDYRGNVSNEGRDAITIE